MAEERKFGVGSGANSKAFATVQVEGKTVELIHGEHPHSYSNNTTYARFPSGTIYDFDGHRVLTRIEIEEYNYIKESEMSGDEIRQGGSVKVFLNGKQVGGEFIRSWQSGIEIAKALHSKIMDHPAWLWEPDVEKRIEGRKVYYKNTPAVLRHYMPDQACVMIDVVPGMQFPLPPHVIDDMDGEEIASDYDRQSIKDSIFSPHIWWYRDRKFSGEE